MTELFRCILNMSISASWLVGVVLVIRLLLKKAPKWITCLLWALVAVRLICPFSIESSLSLIPSAETFPDEMFAMGPDDNRQNAALDIEVNPVIPGSIIPEIDMSVEQLQIRELFASLRWPIGVAVLLVYAVGSYLRLRFKMRTAVRLRDNIYQSENAVTPFVLGFLCPRIYLPFKLYEDDITHVIAHEQTHIKRRDHLLKPLGFLLLSLHWFNPVMWVAYILFCRDIELACDERVIKALDEEQRADYSQALLMCSRPRRAITACPLAFGEVGVKQRVKNIIDYKRPTFWILLASAIVCIAVAVCFLTNPQSVSDEAAQTEPYEIMELSEAEIGEKLTLDDVSRLSKKGYDLDWEDFDKYSYIETGSGLYIRMYEINPNFHLLIGGSGRLDEKPMYFHLTSTLYGDYIDIRENDVNMFVQKQLERGLDSAITQAVLSRDKSENPDGVIHVESHILLDKTELSGTPAFGSKKHTGAVTVYLNVLELSYSAYGDELKEVGGSNIPTVITFSIDDACNYILEDYWIPRDGSFYASDIEGEFTETASRALWGMTKHQADIQRRECLDKAQEILASEGAGDEKTADLIETICSSPAVSSNPGDYIAAHRAEYDELVRRRENTLRYCFSLFLKGEETGLRGHIMALACQDIAENAGEAFSIDGYLTTGQDWFDALLKNAEDMQKQIPMEDLGKHYPVSYFLLELRNQPVRTSCYGADEESHIQ